MHSCKTFLVVGNRYAHEPLRRDFTETILQVSWLPLGASAPSTDFLSVWILARLLCDVAIVLLAWSYVVGGYHPQPISVEVHWPVSVRLSCNLCRETEIMFGPLCFPGGSGAVWVMLGISVPPNSASCVHAQGSRWFYYTEMFTGLRLWSNCLQTTKSF